MKIITTDRIIYLMFALFIVNFSIAKAQISIQEEITDITCYNSEDGAVDITVSGGVPPYTFLWSNGDTTEDIKGLGEDRYAVMVSDANQNMCIASYKLENPEPINLDLYIDQHNLCYGETTFAIAAASGGTGNLSYSWNDPRYQTGVKATGLRGGSYTVVVKDKNNCIASSNFSVYEPDNPLKIMETHKDISCAGGNDGAIFSTASGGTPPYSYEWSNHANTKNIVGLTAGAFTLSVTDQYGCSTNKSIELQALNISISNYIDDTNIKHVTCNGGSNGMIELMINDTLLASYDFLWGTEDGSGLEENATNIQPYLTAGTYNVTITNKDKCKMVSSFNVSEPPDVVIDSTDIILPNNENNGKIRIYASGGTGNFLYSINSGKTYYDNGGYFDDVHHGRYLVTVKDITGCEAIGNVLKIYTAQTGMSDEEIEKPLQEGKMIIYPNPSDGHFNIEFKNPERKDYRLDVYNINGSCVYSQYDHSSAYDVQTDVNLVELPAGVYILSLKGNGLMMRDKLIIK